MSGEKNILAIHKVLQNYGVNPQKCGDWLCADPSIMESILAKILHEIIASDRGKNFLDTYGSIWIRSNPRVNRKVDNAFQEHYSINDLRERVLDNIGQPHLAIYIQRWLEAEPPLYEELKQNVEKKINFIATEKKNMVTLPVLQNDGELSDAFHLEGKIIEFVKNEQKEEFEIPEECTSAKGIDESNKGGLQAASESIIEASGISSAWKNLPVPEGDDRHDEFYNQLVTSPEGLPVIGARARGKKHKHEGTNCDDWFEIAKSGQWTIIAVSDGAGSHFLSRVGAKTASRAAAAHLADKLSLVSLTPRASLSEWEEALQRNAEWVFRGNDIEKIQIALIEATQRSFDAIVTAAQARDAEVRDLSATLLLSVHASIECAGKIYDFIMSSQIGDGMIAAIYQGNGCASLLVEPDAGTFSGQTDFITSKSKLIPASIRTRTNPIFCPMMALMVMTDGVSDDYFPHGPGMQRLYCDMVVNGILSPIDDNSTSLCNDADGRMAPDISDKAFSYVVEREIGGISRKVEVRDAQKLSEQLGQSMEALVKNPRQLMKYSLQSQGAVNSAERLEDWLDSYQVRGSFDDRTLVMMFKSIRGGDE